MSSGPFSMHGNHLFAHKSYRWPAMIFFLLLFFRVLSCSSSILHSVAAMSALGKPECSCKTIGRAHTNLCVKLLSMDTVDCTEKQLIIQYIYHSAVDVPYKLTIKEMNLREVV